MDKDLNFLSQAVASITPASRTATTSSELVADVSNAESITVFVPIGTVTTADGSNLFTFTVLGGAVSDGSDATAVDSSAYLDPKTQGGAVWDRIINATTEGDVVNQFGVKNLRNDRYMFVRATKTGTASAVFGAHIVLGNRRHNVAIA